MANPTCDAVTLITGAVCYNHPPLTPKEQKALRIYAMALQLAAIGGTNYLSSLATTLISDAASMTCGMEESQRNAARINLLFLNATAAGASVPADLDDKLSAIRCLKEADEGALDEAELLLTCRLGVHKAYPQ